MSHHAPRGRIKAQADPSTVPPIQPSIRCKAHRKTGAQCGNRPIPGGVVCRYHGGSAPQVKAAAEKRLADLKPAAIGYLDWLLNQKEYPSAGLGAAKDVLDRNDGKPHESVDMNIHGAVDVAITLKQRFARSAEFLDKMAPAHHTETDAGGR